MYSYGLETGRLEFFSFSLKKEEKADRTYLTVKIQTVFIASSAAALYLSIVPGHEREIVEECVFPL